MLTFDDGHYNNLYYGLPILEKYGAKANINIIGRFSEYTTASGDVDNPNYSHLTWEEIATMWDSGVFEVGNHTYDMHNYKPRYGIAPKSGESEEAYRAALKSDISRLQEKIYAAANRYPTTFAYPFGKYNDVAREVLASLGFTVMMTCNEGVNVLRKGETERLSYIKRYNRSGRYSTRDFLNPFHSFDKDFFPYYNIHDQRRRKRRAGDRIFKFGTGCRQDEKSGGSGQPTLFSCSNPAVRRVF